MSTKQTTPPTSPPKSPAHGQKLKAMDFDSELLPFHVDLSGKVAAVTGGGGILCGHMCRVLAACGAKVAVIDLNKEAADATATICNDAGGEAIGFACNVLEKDSIDLANKAIEAALGPVEILINGAGGNHPKGTTGKTKVSSAELAEDEEGSFFGLEAAGIGFTMNLNYLGTVLSSQGFGKSMSKKGGGNIINISSMTAFCPLTKVMSYGGAKAAVNNFTQWLSVHLAPTGCRVNAIAPGFFLTAQNYKLLMGDNDTPTARCQQILDGTPMGRLGTPEDLTGSILYLCSDKASAFVTGTVMPIDGGFCAYSGV